MLLTGATGRLGTWLRRTAPPEVSVVAVVHRSILAGAVAADLRDPQAVDAVVSGTQPDVVVHTAYAPDDASIVAASANLAAATARMGAGLVHVSTEAVFSGDGRLRAEDDEPDPVNAYGRRKAAAERAVRAAAPGAAVVRAPLLVSLDPPDRMVGAMQAAAAGAAPTTWFDDELRQAARAAEVAVAIWRIVGLAGEARAGAWHLPGPEQLSRAELAHRLVAELGLPAEVVRTGPSPVGSDRPRDLRLLGQRATRQIGWAPRTVLDGRPDVW